METIQLFFLILLHILRGNTSFFLTKQTSRWSFSIAVETHPSSAAWGFICCTLTTVRGSFHLRLSFHGAPPHCFKKYFFTTLVENQEAITVFHWSCKRDLSVTTRKPTAEAMKQSRSSMSYLPSHSSSLPSQQAHPSFSTCHKTLVLIVPDTQQNPSTTTLPNPSPKQCMQWGRQPNISN